MSFEFSLGPLAEFIISSLEGALGRRGVMDLRCGWPRIDYYWWSNGVCWSYGCVRI